MNRRKFLRSLAAAPAMVAMPVLASPVPEPVKLPRLSDYESISELPSKFNAMADAVEAMGGSIWRERRNHEQT